MVRCFFLVNSHVCLDGWVGSTYVTGGCFSGYFLILVCLAMDGDTKRPCRARPSVIIVEIGDETDTDAADQQTDVGWGTKYK